MIDRQLQITPHFRLGELVKDPAVLDLPVEVITNLQRACILVEAIRFHLGLPVVVHSSYRSPQKNDTVGGVHESDHLTGSAIDFHVVAGHGMTWESNTKEAFQYARAKLAGKFGQLILEDHRATLADPEALWVHISIPTGKHPGFGDRSAVLLSPAPGKYEAPSA